MPPVDQGWRGRFGKIDPSDADADAFADAFADADADADAVTELLWLMILLLKMLVLVWFWTCVHTSVSRSLKPMCSQKQEYKLSQH